MLAACTQLHASTFDFTPDIACECTDCQCVDCSCDTPSKQLVVALFDFIPVTVVTDETSKAQETAPSVTTESFVPPSSTVTTSFPEVSDDVCVDGSCSTDASACADGNCASASASSSSSSGSSVGRGRLRERIANLRQNKPVRRFIGRVLFRRNRGC